MIPCCKLRIIMNFHVIAVEVYGRGISDQHIVIEYIVAYISPEGKVYPITSLFSVHCSANEVPDHKIAS